MVVTDAVTVNITSHGAACGCCSCCLATVSPSVGDYTTSDLTTNYTCDMLTTDVDENYRRARMLTAFIAAIVCGICLIGCIIWIAIEGDRLGCGGCGMYVKRNYGGPLGLGPRSNLHST